MYPEVEGTHHVNNADVSAYLLMDFVMQKGMYPKLRSGK